MYVRRASSGNNSTIADMMRFVAASSSSGVGAVFVPSAGAELNRLGVPSGAGLRVKARKAAGAATVGA